MLLGNCAYHQVHLLNYHALQDINAHQRGNRSSVPLVSIVELTLPLALHAQWDIIAHSQQVSQSNALSDSTKIKLSKPLVKVASPVTSVIPLKAPSQSDATSANFHLLMRPNVSIAHLAITAPIKTLMHPSFAQKEHIL